LEKLYISFNKINGTLPTKIGQLTNLREFYAYTNEMTGELPSELGNLVYIENLVLGKNHFEGQLTVFLSVYSFVYLLIHSRFNLVKTIHNRQPTY
jgi:hypothetical protein